MIGHVFVSKNSQHAHSKLQRSSLGGTQSGKCSLWVPMPCQVGSKNAAFFMGSTIKVVTKRGEEPYVHELGLAAEELEQRYRNQEVSAPGSGRGRGGVAQHQQLPASYIPETCRGPLTGVICSGSTGTEQALACHDIDNPTPAERRMKDLCAAGVQAVYEEEMVHRNPGDISTLSTVEQPFGAARTWVQQETDAVAAGDQCKWRCRG